MPVLALMGSLACTVFIILMVITKGILPDFACLHCGRTFVNAGSRHKHQRECNGEEDNARWAAGNVAARKQSGNGGSSSTLAQPDQFVGPQYHDSPRLSPSSPRHVDGGDTSLDTAADIPHSMRKRRAASSPGNMTDDHDCHRPLLETAGEADSRIRHDLEALLASSLSGKCMNYLTWSVYHSLRPTYSVATDTLTRPPLVVLLTTTAPAFCCNKCRN